MCFSVLSLMRMMVFLVCNTELTSNGCLLQFINAIISGFKTVFSFFILFPSFSPKKICQKKSVDKIFLSRGLDGKNFILLNTIFLRNMKKARINEYQFFPWGGRGWVGKLLNFSSPCFHFAI